MYDSSKCDISKNDCVVTLYLNWKENSQQNKQQHYVNIIYDMNGGSLNSQHGSTISSNGSTLLCNKKKVCTKLVYNGKLGKGGLRNYNNKNSININKKGYIFNGWNTKQDGSGKNYDQSTTYKASDFCDASNKDCQVTLYAKWKKKEIQFKQDVYTYKLNDKDCVHVWYAIIPKKYNMHYAYGGDKILGKETPTTMAKKHGATLAIDTEFLGLPMKNGKLMKEGDSVKGYDFTIEYNENHKYNYEIFNVFLTDAGKGHITFKDINLGFDYGGNGLHYHPYDTKDSKTGEEKKGVMYMALYEQIVMDGKQRDYEDTYLTERHPRTWLAYDYECNQYVAVAGGRKIESTVNGETCTNDSGIYAIGDELTITTEIIKKNIGNLPENTSIKTLYNLDGGGSTAFVYEGKKQNPEVNYGGERPVYGIFYWKW